MLFSHCNGLPVEGLAHQEGGLKEQEDECRALAWGRTHWGWIGMKGSSAWEVHRSGAPESKGQRMRFPAGVSRCSLEKMGSWLLWDNKFIEGFIGTERCFLSLSLFCFLLYFTCRLMWNILVAIACIVVCGGDFLSLITNV